MSLYTMKLSDSVDTMEFNLLEVPIQDKDIEGAVDNVVLSGDIYTDFLWLKKRFTHKWSILCKDDYERLRGFYTRQFSNAEVPIYQLLDAPSPVEESAGSGEYIQITTTDSTAKLASVEMLGKAEQDGTPTPDSPQPISVVTGENTVKIEGKNLLQIPDGTNTSAGVTFTASNGTLTASGTTTRGSYAENDSIFPTLATYGNYPNYASTTEANSIELPAGTYTASAEITKTGKTSAGVAFCTGATMGTRVTGVTKLEVLVNDATGTYTKTATFTIAEGERLYVSTYYEGSSTKKNVGFTISNIQLELGSTATAYEPYQGQEFEVNLGKNLLDPSATLQGVWNNASNTTTCTFFTPIYTGESFTISNQDTATWRFSAGLTTSPTNNPAGTGSQISAWQTGTSYTITAQSDGYLWVQLRKNANTAITPSDIPTDVFMVERGSTATDFAPYFTPIELAKIGNYQDRIYKNNGKWYIEKQVGKVVLNGTESTLYATSGTSYAWSGVGTNFVKNVDFLTNYASTTPTSGTRIKIPNNNLYFYDSGYTSIDNLKTALASTNLVVYAPLATPTTTEITNEALVAQLEALGASSLYLGVNNIGTETLNAVPTLALTYFPYYPHEIISPKAVRMELTDGGIINACECRENVQITLRETIQ